MLTHLKRCTERENIEERLCRVVKRVTAVYYITPLHAHCPHGVLLPQQFLPDAALLSVVYRAPSKMAKCDSEGTLPEMTFSAGVRLE